MNSTDIGKQEEGCTSRVWKIKFDSEQIELQWTAGEIEANSNTMHHKNAKKLCHAIKGERGNSMIMIKFVSCIKFNWLQLNRFWVHLLNALQPLI